MRFPVIALNLKFDITRIINGTMILLRINDDGTLLLLDYEPSVPQENSTPQNRIESTKSKLYATGFVIMTAKPDQQGQISYYGKHFAVDKIEGYARWDDVSTLEMYYPKEARKQW